MGRRRSFGGNNGHSRYNRKLDALTYRAPAPQGRMTAAFPQQYFNIVQWNDVVSNTAAANFVINELAPMDVNAVFGSENYEWTDKCFAIWTRAVVLGYAWEVRFTNLNTATSLDIYCLPWPENEDPTNELTIAFQKGVQTRFVGPAVPGGRSTTVMKGYVNTSSLTGVKLVNEEAYWCREDGNPPTINPKFYFATQDNSSTAANNYQVHLNLKAYVKWFGFKLQPAGPTLTNLAGIPFASHRTGRPPVSAQYIKCGGDIVEDEAMDDVVGLDVDLKEDL